MKDLLEDGLDGSRLSEATALIGRYVEGVDAGGNYLTGQVERVELIDGVATLKVGEGLLLVEQVFTIDDQPAVEEEQAAEAAD